MWSLIEPAVVDAAAPEGVGVATFTLQLADYGDGPTQVVFSAASMDQGDGEIGTIATVLMEVGTRLPAGSGMDEAVWFISNSWLHPEGAAERTTQPCIVRGSEEATLIVWSGDDGEGLSTFFGTVGPYDAVPAEVEACKALLAQGTVDSAAPATDAAVNEPSVDYSVPPDEANELIRAGGHTVIDVRTPAEYEQARVVGAINIDVEAPDFAERIAELDPDEPYLLYCRTGRRSDLAAQQMAAAGFSDITDAAGLADLARAGAPIE